MPGQRKLFIAHASELAHRCVRAVRGGSGGLVAKFVRSYAERYNRPGLAMSAERNREFDSTIGREALLVAAARVSRMLLAAFGRTRGSSRSPCGKRNQNVPYFGPEEAALAQAFYAEFLASLGRSLEWSPNEAATESAAFRRDLEMYQRWSGRSESQLATQLNPQFSPSFDEGPTQQFPHRSDAHWEASGKDYPSGTNPGAPAIKVIPSESPFADRCALLLDPDMMEQARKAAAEFEGEVSRTTARMFSQLGRRTNTKRQSQRRLKPSRTVRTSAARKNKTPLTAAKKVPHARKQRSAKLSAHGSRSPRNKKLPVSIRNSRGKKPKTR